MMRLRVISAFSDKYTDEFYPVGTEMTVKDDRGDELLSNPQGLVELVEQTKRTKRA